MLRLKRELGRIGTSDKEELVKIDKLLSSEKSILKVIFSHYSNADGSDNNYDDYQTKKLR